MAGESTLLVQEFFESGDSRFIDELLRSTAAKKLKALAERWYGDERSFARDALLVYIDDGCDRPHHRPLVKALLKKAEAAADDEAMAHFLVAFDRLIVRKVVTLNGWNYQTKTPTKQAHISPDKRFRATSKTGVEPHFSLRTRRYLQRRAFRYFRKIAKSDLPRFSRGVRLAASLYQDAHLDSAQKLLDSWSLLHILYGRSPVLSRVPRGIVLAPGRALGELTPAPIYPSAWKNCLGDLVTLLKKAQSYTVRSFALTLLQTEYASQLGSIAPLRLRALLLSPHEEVQNFAANLLKSARDIHLLPVADWLDLLKVESPTALEVVCELVKKHVTPGRLTLAECVALGCQRPAPIAELGLAWARSKKLSTEEDLVTLLAFSKAECAKVRTEAATFVKDILQKSLATRPEHVRDFLDSRYSDVRGAAFELMTHDPRFRDASLLWAALAESPYDDVRTFLLRHVQIRGEKAHPGSLTAVWSTVLLGIARGSRTKRRALGQVATEVASHPEKADELLPLLGVALRSVRPPERRAAVSAVAQAAAKSPSLSAALTRRLPEIVIKPEVVR